MLVQLIGRLHFQLGTRLSLFMRREALIGVMTTFAGEPVAHLGARGRLIAINFLELFKAARDVKPVAQTL